MSAHEDGLCHPQPVAADRGLADTHLMKHLTELG